MVATRNHKHAHSSSNYCAIMMIQNLKKINKSKISNFFRISAARCAELKQTTTAKRLLFALGWHFMPHVCEFFLEIFEFKNFVPL